LAKLANHIAKTAERKPGSYPEKLTQVCNLSALPQEELEAVLAATAVNEVWGVGRRISAKLTEGGVTTVLDLVRADPATIRRKFSVMLERTVRELQGTQCVDLEHLPQPKQEIACTRSFGHPITELCHLAEAVTEFASRAAQKLRKQHSLTGQVLCFIRTSPFRSDPQYSRSITVPRRRPSADTALIVAAALAGLRAIYRPGFKMAKAGVMLLELQSDSVVQQELALEDDDAADRGRLMETLDGLNLRYGRGTVSMASAGLAGEQRTWSMKQERRTPQYTTRWDDIAVARA
jgi:DNA polymerase V